MKAAIAFVIALCFVQVVSGLGSNTLVVYAYSSENTENFKAFTSRALIADADFLIMADAPVADLDRSNVEVIPFRGTCEECFAMEAFNKAVEKAPEYEYYIFVDSRASGPFSFLSTSWTSVLTSQLSNGARLAGPVVSCEQETPMVVGGAFATDAAGLSTIKAANGFTCNRDLPREKQGHSMSRAVLSSGSNIAAVFAGQNNVDWRNPATHSCADKADPFTAGISGVPVFAIEVVFGFVQARAPLFTRDATDDYYYDDDCDEAVFFIFNRVLTSEEMDQINDIVDTHVAPESIGDGVTAKWTTSAEGNSVVEYVFDEPNGDGSCKGEDLIDAAKAEIDAVAPSTATTGAATGGGSTTGEVDDDEEDEGSNGGAIAGGVIAALAVCALCIGGVYYFTKSDDAAEPQKTKGRGAKGFAAGRGEGESEDESEDEDEDSDEDEEEESSEDEEM